MAQEDEIEALQEKIPSAATLQIGDIDERLTSPAREVNTPLASVGVLSSSGKVMEANIDIGSVQLVDSTFSKWFMKLDLDGGSIFTALTTIGDGHRRILQRFGGTHIDLTSNLQKTGVLWTLTPVSADEFALTTGPGPNNALATDGFAIFTNPGGSPWRWSATPPIPPSPPSPPPITVATYWWGFHLKILEATMTDWVGVGVTVGEVLSMVAGFTGPAEPFVEAAAEYIRAEFALARQVDEGNGVYVSMTWFAPGIFVPTPIKIGDP